MTDDSAHEAIVYLLHYSCIEQKIIMEDGGGLYIIYQGQRVDCRPARNAGNKTIPDVYIGSYPWLKPDQKENVKAGF